MNELLMFTFGNTVCGINKLFVLRENKISAVMLQECNMCISFNPNHPNREFVHKDRFSITRDLIRGGGLEQLRGRVFVQLNNPPKNHFTTWEATDIMHHRYNSLEGIRMIEVNLDIIPNHLRFDTLLALCNL